MQRHAGDVERDLARLDLDRAGSSSCSALWAQHASPGSSAHLGGDHRHRAGRARRRRFPPSPVPIPGRQPERRPCLRRARPAGTGPRPWLRTPGLWCSPASAASSHCSWARCADGSVVAAARDHLLARHHALGLGHVAAHRATEHRLVAHGAQNRHRLAVGLTGHVGDVVVVGVGAAGAIPSTAPATPAITAATRGSFFTTTSSFLLIEDSATDRMAIPRRRAERPIEAYRRESNFDVSPAHPASSRRYCPGSAAVAPQDVGGAAQPGVPVSCMQMRTGDSSRGRRGERRRRHHQVWDLVLVHRPPGSGSCTAVGCSTPWRRPP